jgi:tetratricopeptide (TPR) repeat protein
VTRFAKHLRARQRWMWLGPLLAVVALALGFTTYRMVSNRVDAQATYMRAEGIRSLEQDDGASLDTAATLLREAARLDPRLFQADADRALALFLKASVLEEEVAELDRTFKELQGRNPDREPTRQRMAEIKGRRDPKAERAGQLKAEALATLSKLQGQIGTPEVLRGLTMGYALEGNVEQVVKLVKLARDVRIQDPWIDLAEQIPALRSRDPQEKAHAATVLGTFAAAHPSMLRARILLARVQAELDQREAALSTLDALLAANPVHERAQALKSKLLGPPEAKPVAPSQVPERQPGVRTPGLLPRK